jgi:hypothetical protein
MALQDFEEIPRAAVADRAVRLDQLELLRKRSN